MSQALFLIVYLIRRSGGAVVTRARAPARFRMVGSLEVSLSNGPPQTLNF
jgi:hypothetical protein